jgi:hypothetical protein
MTIKEFLNKDVTKRLMHTFITLCIFGFKLGFGYWMVFYLIPYVIDYVALPLGGWLK